MSHLDYEPTPEQQQPRYFMTGDNGKPLSRKPSCTDYVECNDKHWNKERRDYWKQQSDESMRHIQAKYSPVPACKPPQATKQQKWHKVTS